MLTILGAGAWAKALQSAAPTVSCWGRHVPLEQHLRKEGIALLAIPAQEVRLFLPRLLPFSVRGIVIASKGMEKGTGLLLSEVVQQVLGKVAIGVLSGPNLADEVAKGQWAGTTLATDAPFVEEAVKKAFDSGPLYIQTTTDIVGTQVAGVMKNTMAIGYGFLQQLGVGDNGCATYLVRALAEIRTFGMALGGQESTWMGYAGMGDLLLTCTSQRSRNAQFGRLFGKQQTEFLAEGQFSVPAVLLRAHKMGLSMPLTQGIQAILTGEKPVSTWPACIQEALLI